ncbi:MAG TPA: hypothetical protein VGE45_20815 [Chloroflexia bacterium]|jgi:hypothetical protein
MQQKSDKAYPLPITRALGAAVKLCGGEDGAACHDAVLQLADALTYYLGAVAVAQYSQALYLEQAEADPTLNRSLRSLRRVLPGQWLGWTARGLAATPNGTVEGLARWYEERQAGEVAQAYAELRRVMVERLAYAGEYGPQERVSPRLLLELVDQYRIRRGKSQPDALSPDTNLQVGCSLLKGLQALLESADFLPEYQLYAPQQRQMLMGQKATTPMPPIPVPVGAEASVLFYPPGEMPDYTKRPNLQAERQPLFPLDPLLIYTRCEECDRYRAAALREVISGVPSYLGLDPDCRHAIQPPLLNEGV